MSLKLRQSKPEAPAKKSGTKLPEVLDTEIEGGHVEVNVSKRKMGRNSEDFKTVKQRGRTIPPHETPAGSDQMQANAGSGQLAKVRSGLSVTLSFDFQSVRVDASVEWPCLATKEAVAEAHALGYKMASEAMIPEIEEAKNFLAGGKAGIFGDL